MKLNKLNLLFVCSMGLNRSKTASEILKNVHNTKSSGSGDVTKKDFLYADKIYVMERRHKNNLILKFGERYADKIIELDIPDNYLFMDNDLIRILNDRFVRLGLI